MPDRTALSYWLPKLEAAGLPVPKTTLVAMPAEALRDIYRVFDGEAMTGRAQPFFDDIKVAADAIGYPCFLRTDHTSGKHNWERTCYLAGPDAIPAHVIGIVEYSGMAGIVGLPCDVWAVREFLPTRLINVAPRFGNMPICREFRFFIEDAHIRCWHPYWPREALEQGGVGAAEIDSVYEQLCQVDDEAPLMELASAAGHAAGGAWSVDLLETARGWHVTDMAEAEKSFHWEGCRLGPGARNQ